ncbi:protein of unknown function, partial [Taphrina deformans PYCC 5710]
MTGSTPKVTLYTLQNSQGFRILWMLHHLSIPHTTVCIRRNKERSYPDLKAVHPLGKSPVLVVDGVVTAESRLCAAEVSSLRPERLRKEGEEARADGYYAEFSTATMTLDSMLCLIFDIAHTSAPRLLQPLVGVLVRPLVRFMGKEMHEPLKMMHGHLSSNEWFGGKSLGVSDFMMSWPIDIVLHRGIIDLDDERWSNVGVWYRKITALESYQNALKEVGEQDLAHL